MALKQVNDVACPDVALFDDSKVEPRALALQIFPQDIVATKPRVERSKASEES